jgi:hypothetical protein
MPHPSFVITKFYIWRDMVSSKRADMPGVKNTRLNGSRRAEERMKRIGLRGRQVLEATVMTEGGRRARCERMLRLEEPVSLYYY